MPSSRIPIASRPSTRSAAAWYAFAVIEDSRRRRPNPGCAVGLPRPPQSRRMALARRHCALPLPPSGPRPWCMAATLAFSGPGESRTPTRARLRARSPTRRTPSRTMQRRTLGRLSGGHAIAAGGEAIRVPCLCRAHVCRERLCRAIWLAATGTKKLEPGSLPARSGLLEAVRLKI